MSQSKEELPLFSKCHDFLAWLVPLTNHFPRVHRHTITQRLLNAALDFQECLLEANRQRGQKRLEKLVAADSHLDKVRMYLRLLEQWHWISLGQYQHASRMVVELGRLVGGWQKVTTLDRQSSAHQG